jgi:hypothetical protein
MRKYEQASAALYAPRGTTSTSGLDVLGSLRDLTRRAATEFFVIKQEHLVNG